MKSKLAASTGNLNITFTTLKSFSHMKQLLEFNCNMTAKSNINYGDNVNENVNNNFQICKLIGGYEKVKVYCLGSMRIIT